MFSFADLLQCSVISRWTISICCCACTCNVPAKGPFTLVPARAMWMRFAAASYSVNLSQMRVCKVVLLCSIIAPVSCSCVCLFAHIHRKLTDADVDVNL